MTTKIIDDKPYTLKLYLNKLSINGYLIKTLTKRELKSKYNKSAIGFGWVILQPLLVVVVYTVFFKNIIKIDTAEIPYPQFVLTGLVLWYLFTGIISKCSYSLIESSDLLNKLSFPRIIILISKCIPTIIECFVLLIAVFIALLFTDYKIGINSLTSLFYFIEIIVISLAIGILCSIIVLKRRDFVQIIPFLINFGIWLTPVFYSTKIIPDDYKNILFYVNPLVIPIEELRSCIFNNTGISFISWIGFICSCILLTISFFVFIKYEKRIVDNL